MERSGSLLRVLACLGVLALATVSFIFEIIPKFRNGITVLAVLQLAHWSKIFPLASVYRLLQSKRCITLYTVSILVALAEAVLQKCGFEHSMLTKAAVLVKPMMNLGGFAYSIINVQATVSMIMVILLMSFKFMVQLIRRFSFATAV